MNDYNYVRSESLVIPSIEFFALICAFLLFLFYTNRKLIELYIISIPFNDKVYRIFSLQPSDILSILIIIINLRYISTNLKYLYWLVPPFFIGSLIGFFQFGDLFGVQYSFRVLLIFGTVNIISSYLANKELDIETCSKIYKAVVWLSLFVAATQVILWYLGFPIAGIFYSFGIPRMKGLSHEPSTFCFWLVMSLPFGIQKNADKKKAITFDTPYISALLLMILFTGSTSGIISALTFFFLLTVFELRQNLDKLVKYIFAIVLTIIILGSLNSSAASYFSEYAIAKVDSYISEMVSGESKGEVSGRGGDRKLIKYFSDNPLFGIGAFRSSQISDPDDYEDYIPGSNFYITTPTEFGIVGSLCMLWVFTAWFKILYKIRNPSNIMYGLALITWTVSLIGMRAFGFPQPWFIMSMYVSLYLINKPIEK